MFYLDNLRDFPQHMRSKTLDVDTHSFGNVNYDNLGRITIRGGIPGHRKQEFEVIYDDEPTTADQNNCIHWKRVVEYPSRLGDSPVCVQKSIHIDYVNANDLEKEITPDLENNALAPFPVELFMSQRVVQDALANLYVKQANKLYRLTSKELPDLTVFFAEIMELRQIYSIVHDTLMHGKRLKKSYNTLVRRLKRLQRMKKTTVVKRYIRDVKIAIQAVSADC